MEKLMSVSELAKYLSLTSRTIYNLINRGGISYVRVGGQYRFKKEQIDGWLEEKSVKKKFLNLERVKDTKDPLTKRLLFMALLTEALKPQGHKPVVVGGNAVEFYTAGGYATADIDVVVPSEPVDAVLKKWGFKKEGRFWLSEELDIIIEAPLSFLDPEQLKRVCEVEIDSFKVYVLGLEDLIVDRLNAYVHWSPLDDGRWAKELIALHLKEIDWAYLKKRAKEEDIEEALLKFKKELGVD